MTIVLAVFVQTPCDVREFQFHAKHGPELSQLVCAYTLQLTKLGCAYCVPLVGRLVLISALNAKVLTTVSGMSSLLMWASRLWLRVYWEWQCRV